MYNKIKFGQMVYNKRKLQRYSQEEMAEICSLSDRCIRNIESGKSDPKLSTVLAVCSACQMNLGEFSELMKEGACPV